MPSGWGIVAIVWIVAIVLIGAIVWIVAIVFIGVIVGIWQGCWGFILP